MEGLEISSVIVEARNKIAVKLYDSAAQLLINEYTQNKPRVKQGLGLHYFQKIIPSLLAMDMKLEVAHLLWGREMFNAESYSVKKIWESLRKETEVIIIGAGSMGKSYTVAGYILLDWLEDPLNTCVKVVSVTREHAQRNVFAHIRNLHKASAIPLPGDATKDSIQASEDDAQGIHLVAIPQGQDGSGRLQGFHPKPRQEAHPKYGTLTRVKAVLDEGEEVPNGVWPDIDNMLITKENEGPHVQVISCANPRDMESPFGQRCEPEKSWSSIDIEDSHEWPSKMGWKVVRLDGAKCENVIQRKVVNSGMLTYEGYRRYVIAGTDNAEYYCADMETEVLSLRGWLQGDKVREGDFVYTVNPRTGKAEWNVVEEVFCKHYEGDLISMESRFLSAFVTPNHRWAVTNKSRVSARLVFKETMQLARHDLIPTGAPSIDNSSTVSCDIAELAGWILGDGTFMPGNRVAIYQSNTANPEKCAQIENLLTRIGVKFQKHNFNGILHFRFSRGLGRCIKRVLPGKKLTLDFIESLNNEGRQRLLKGLILSDGGIQGGSTPYVCTKEEDQAEVYSILMIRLGFAPRIYKKFVAPNVFPNGLPSRGCWMYYVDAAQPKRVCIKYAPRIPKPYSGNVWCPRTANTTFLARRHGKVYFTGNTMARGWFPPRGVQAYAVPQEIFQGSIGRATFIGKVVYCAAADLALEGTDRAVMSVGKFGMASGCEKHGKFVQFAEPKWVLQLESQFEVNKFDPEKKLEQTIWIAKEIQRHCKNFGISPNYLIVDRTGNGSGVHDVLKQQFGREVVGVNYGTGSTEMKVLEDDTQPAEELYDGVVTELFFAARKFMEASCFRISTAVRLDRLSKEITERKFRDGRKGLIRVESKIEYKSRGNDSPDWADSATLLIHLVRLRKEFRASLIASLDKEPDGPLVQPGMADKLEYLQF